MNRRQAVQVLLATLGGSRSTAAGLSVSTLLGTGVPGYADQQVNNPYGLAFGPGGALYFCDLDNQRIRRVDLKTRRVVNGHRRLCG